ncbi:hypothetical protein [Cytophaga aurantiaca]|uniref:hypothetical protein n=1 Tax=Cytophaga aurantiaca TaxID=29530 RepID=UPI0012F8B7D9|nr:hypothetical protein [Cytophaga aurantiaca]
MKNAKTIQKVKKSTGADDYDQPPKKSTHVGPNEFEETRSDKIRMKPQPFKGDNK